MATHIQPERPRRQGHRRRDRRTARPRGERKFSSGIEIVLLAIFAIVMLFPVVWMLETALKDDVATSTPSRPRSSRAGRRRSSTSRTSSAPTRPCFKGFKNSVIVAGSSTIIATALGVPAAWAYSRFKIQAKKDQLFFILSTRFMPPVVVVIPVFLMFR